MSRHMLPSPLLLVKPYVCGFEAYFLSFYKASSPWASGAAHGCARKRLNGWSPIEVV